jgi:hypothetical protein
MLNCSLINSLIKRIRELLGEKIRKQANRWDSEQIWQSGQYGIWIRRQWLAQKIRGLSCWISGHKWADGDHGNCVYDCGWRKCSRY